MKLFNPKQEPVWTGAIARIIVAVAAGYGFDLSVTEVAAILAAVEVVIAIITRANVAPMENVARLKRTP